jgi:hypothetical protein
VDEPVPCVLSCTAARPPVDVYMPPTPSCHACTCVFMFGCVCITIFVERP